ncbi:MAG: gene transfer agent family protein [Paracoccus sp. (in: a-proteobacteria)]|nr:gene transfer agent family protein [Paracoccus sp. (in: a-proteobacteria)]
MVNPLRGEVAVVINGESFVARLTLGALAELEQVLGASSLLDLAERFETGRFSGRDVLAVLAAGLRGAGWTGEIEQLAWAQIEGGPVEAARLAARLLVLAFRVPA